MVVQVVAHAWQIMHRLHTHLSQMRGRPDARQHEYLRRQQRTGTQQHLAARMHCVAHTATHIFHPRCTQSCLGSCEHNPQHLRPGTYLQITAPPMRGEVSLGGTPPLPIFLGHLVKPYTFLAAAIEVCIARKPRLHARFDKVLTQAVGLLQVRHIQRPALAMPGVGPAFVVLRLQKPRLDICPSPPGITLCRPAVIVLRLPPQINHRVDRTAAPQHLSARLITTPPVQTSLRYRLHRPIEVRCFGHGR